MGLNNKVITKGRTCTFEGCNKKHVALGLCRTHYNQQRTGRELAPITSPWANRGDPPERFCHGCKETKPREQFYRRKNGTYTQCMECVRADVNQRRQPPKAGVSDGQATGI